MADRNTTDVLSGDLNDNANLKWLYDRFIKEVLAFVDRQVSGGLKQSVDVDAVAHDSWLAAIKALTRDRGYRPNSPAFRALLYAVAKGRISNAVRFAQAQERDTKRNSSLQDGERRVEITKGGLSPAEDAAITLTFQEGLALLLQEPDEQRRLINVLAVTLDLNASEVKAILDKHPAHFRVLSIPTIRTQIEKAKRLMQALMGED